MTTEMAFLDEASAVARPDEIDKSKHFALSSLRVVDLFAGCGAMSMGFQNAGYLILALTAFGEGGWLVDSNVSPSSHPATTLWPVYPDSLPALDQLTEEM